MHHPSLSVKVWGDLACFTRPEMKVERVSYPVITPSAARAILQAIFWKPEFDWRVQQIDVLNPIRYFSILRNEIKTRQSERAARGWVGEPDAGFFADEDRTQRHTLGLREVAYVIHADIDLKPHATAPVAAYRDQFRRRVARGQCTHRPAFGCREFAAHFADPAPEDRPLAELNMDLGLMLFDLKYKPNRQGPNEPAFFPASLANGVLRVPGHLYDEGYAR